MFIAEHRDRFGVEPCWRVLGFAVSTYDDHVTRAPSSYELEDVALAERVTAHRERSGKTYGSPRIHAGGDLGVGLAGQAVRDLFPPSSRACHLPDTGAA